MEEPPVVLPMSAPLPQERERADARRNRERILCAAADLIRVHGVDAVSMDDVAAEAGVGKGTLYRRFGDRGSLLRALIEEPEREFQDALIRGAPPVGPGAPPRERLHAFGNGALRLLERNARFQKAADDGRLGRFAHPVYAFQRTHVTVLLREAMGDDPRIDYFADCLLGPLSPSAFLYQRELREMSLEELFEGWRSVVDAILGLARP